MVTRKHGALKCCDCALLDDQGTIAQRLCNYDIEMLISVAKGNTFENCKNKQIYKRVYNYDELLKQLIN